MNAILAVLLAFPVVVMYHRVDVSAPRDPVSQRLTISPAQFADELRSIHRMGFHTIGIAELAHDMATRQPRMRAVLITFDDGYSDQFRYAFPILERFGDRATFFVNVGTIGTPRHLTWSDVDAMSKAGMSIECHGVDHVESSVPRRRSAEAIRSISAFACSARICKAAFSHTRIRAAISTDGPSSSSGARAYSSALRRTRDFGPMRCRRTS